MKSLTVFACEPQPILLEGLEKVFRERPGLALAGAAPSLAEAVHPIGALRPDVVLLDQTLGLKPVLQFLAGIPGLSPSSHGVLWVHELSETECFRALQLGARGILKKTLPVDSLLDCLHAVGAGAIWMEGLIPRPPADGQNRRSAPRLTPREREIVGLVAQGLKNRQVADNLQITPGTVKVHLMHIFEKTGVKDRFELAFHGRRLLTCGAEEPAVCLEEKAAAL